MGLPETPRRSRVPWALAVTVGLCSGLAGYVIHAARVNRIPKQVVTVKRLTDMAGSEESPAISPDGKKVAFVAASGSKRQIWTVSAVDSDEPHPITHDDADHFGPRWSADSSSLIYFAAGVIWEIPAQGGEAHRLVDAVVPGDLSHEGNRLAFLRIREGGTELLVDGRTIVKLPGDETYIYSNLRWSPDDKKIAFLQSLDVMVEDLSGGSPVLAAGGDMGIQGFAWAPDNSGLIVSSVDRRISSIHPYQLWFIPRKENGSSSQLTFGELSYESPDIRAGGDLVVSRRGLNVSAGESDIVMFSGLKW